MAEGTELDYQLLGLMELWVGGEQRKASQAKPRGVLALLLLNLNRPVSTDQLIELLWPDKPPGRPQTAIQGYVSGLRKLLGQGTIETTAAGYVLHAEAEQLDVNRFERLLREGREALAVGHTEEAARGLSEGLELWRGPRAGRLHLRAVGPERDRAAGGAASGRARGAPGGEARARAARRGRRQSTKR